MALGVNLRFKTHVLGCRKRGITSESSDHHIFISCRANKVEAPNPTFSAITVTWPFARKYPYWTAQIYVEIIDEYYDQSLWTFPEVSALRDLWTSVKYQASGVKDLLDDLLQDEESS